ncbi:hydroxylysine kinase-like [Anneissia japonica]|uniref:hydroxylysine kinase-like n=1 Tax=Anneissia japonica TaxID=1529436 RepID=UPI001425B866|nr:hydroxylysine kinase-like [Anneissia japonica]
MSFEDSEESFLPLVDLDDVAGIIGDLYGISADGVSELKGFSDKNFYLKVAHPELRGENVCTEFVLKITNLEDSRKVTLLEGQTAVMLHLKRQGVKCCRPILNMKGNYMHLVRMKKICNGIKKHGSYIIRLVNYVKGQMMSSLVIDSTLLSRFGVFLAEIHLSLQNFKHDSFKETDDYEFNLSQVVNLSSSKLDALNDDHKQHLSRSVIEAFRTEVLPKCKQLKEGIIHGDFRPENIIIDYTDKSSALFGVIDFGDTIRSYVLFDVAIAIAHSMLHDTENCLNVASLILGGYTSISPLPTWELRLLLTCVQARLIQVLVFCWNRYLELPENADYMLDAERKGGWELVETLQSVSHTDWMRYINEAGK